MKKTFFRLMILCILVSGVSVGVFGQIYTTIDPRYKTRKADAGNNIPVIVSISATDDIFLNSKKIAKDEITEKINRLMDEKSSEQEIVYIKADFNLNYGSVVEIMKLGRAAQIDDYGLIVGAADANNASVSGALDIKIPFESDSEEDSKPYPYALIVAPGKDGQITLNKKPFTPEALAAKLRQTFVQRKQKRIYMAGSREVEKTVFIQAPLSAKYGDVVNIIKIVKSTGAFPIALSIDDLPK